MERKTLREMRGLAAAAASQRGHRIKGWQPDGRSSFCFTSRCKTCHAWLQVKALKLPLEEAQKIGMTGFMIVEDTHAFSDQDYVGAIGSALIIDCWMNEIVR
jgi:hypothetical protein